MSCLSCHCNTAGGTVAGKDLNRAMSSLWRVRARRADEDLRGLGVYAMHHAALICLVTRHLC